MAVKLEKNAAGRMVPVEVNGCEGVPFEGVGKHRPDGCKASPRISSCADFPAGGDKRAGSLRKAPNMKNVAMRIGKHMLVLFIDLDAILFPRNGIVTFRTA